MLNRKRKNQYFGVYSSKSEKYQSPPPVRGGRYVPRRGHRPHTIRTAKPPNFGQEKPAKTCGHVISRAFRASENGNFSRRKSKSGRISPPTPPIENRRNRLLPSYIGSVHRVPYMGGYWAGFAFCLNALPQTFGTRSSSRPIFWTPARSGCSSRLDYPFAEAYIISEA